MHIHAYTVYYKKSLTTGFRMIYYLPNVLAFARTMSCSAMESKSVQALLFKSLIFTYFHQLFSWNLTTSGCVAEPGSNLPWPIHMHVVIQWESRVKRTRPSHHLVEQDVVQKHKTFKNKQLWYLAVLDLFDSLRHQCLPRNRWFLHVEASHHINKASLQFFCLWNVTHPGWARCIQDIGK